MQRLREGWGSEEDTWWRGVFVHVVMFQLTVVLNSLLSSPLLSFSLYPIRTDEELFATT